jgi:penicillin-binding protein 1A
VWIGFDQPRPITAVATGGRVAAPVWARLMTRYHSGRRMPGPWRPPTGVFQASVDPATGLILAEGCQPQAGVPYREFFVRGMSPQSVCPSRGAPVEMLADVALPLPDDEEATELSLELPEELREPLPGPDTAEEATEETEAPETAEVPAERSDAEDPALEEQAEEPAPSPRATPNATPRPSTPTATPATAPTPRATPAPVPEATPTPTPPPSDPPS